MFICRNRVKNILFLKKCVSTILEIFFLILKALILGNKFPKRN
ncbi:hypothetical protein LEP1GSC074_2763 [Leptospira noguchii str. Hook]|uniref:Uncharacterized protein n=2 Tax=Leptospira noguchii TaxID=28182 RepID=M6UAT4_9LEPT|nr:hypothetical protein LEP1GSC035_1928 [Leptospira noguchii str. 2007001578]EMO42142.1 hypothetical protein LEP1GSC186_0398 [Leptospira noguchii serovar Autumnalis str. ZUN142]EMS88471.1 hypothetical protein LEP1GSC074_2763 [Leptospira noguchii str. Hook]